MATISQPDERRTVAARVSIVGLCLAVVPVVHFFRHQQTLVSVAIGVVVPLLFAGTLVGAGQWLATRDFRPDQLARVSHWMVAGIVTGVLIGVQTTVHQSALGAGVPEAPFVVGNSGIAGAVGGLGLGYYEALGRRQAQRLAQSTAKFEAVFEGTHDALLIADDEGTYVDANPAAAALFGVDREALIGMSIRDFADADFDFDREWSSFRQVKTGRGQFPLVRPDGTKRIVEFAATSDVYPGHHLSALRDVTDRVTYEQELEHQHETLAFLNQILRHNVLNGIHVILAHADLLSEQVDDHSQASVQAIRDRGDRIADLISRVHRLNRATAAGHQLERVDVGTTLSTVVDAARSAFPEAAIDCPDELPTGLTVDADAMLEEVFENLVGNALSHNDSDRSELNVDVTADGDTVTVTVADNGPGIPDAKKDIVFGRGEKGPASDGTGFGLYIVRSLVTRYGGTVEVTDNDPRGSVFVVRLPLLDRQPATV